MESQLIELDDIVKDLRALDLGHKKNHHQQQNPKKDDAEAVRTTSSISYTLPNKDHEELLLIKKSQQQQKQQEQQQEQQIQPSCPPDVIICDAWYGFPTEKRPRKERILAVSKQIYNVLIWRCEFHHALQCRKIQGEDSSSHVIVIGKVEDVNAIHERVNDLFGSSEKGLSEDMCSDPFTKCVFLPGMTLEEIVSGKGHPLLFLPTLTGKEKEKEALQEEDDGQKEAIVYLSPDADERLDPYQAPPRIVVVGMLVDRKVQPNRSKLRAQEFSDQTTSKNDDNDVSRMQVRRLPMDNLRVVDLRDDEPLNIDTVMEIMERWWANIRVWKETKGESLDQDRGYDSRPFADAAIRALHSHRKRHPNRTIHGGISTGTV